MRHVVNGAIATGSVLLCLLALPTRVSGMELLGIGPNWLLIWVVAWSINRSMWQGAFAGLVLGLLQDGLSSPHPTHALSLIAAGVITARLQKHRYLQEDFISIALIVFGMTVLAETISAIQFSLQTIGQPMTLAFRSLNKIWAYHQYVTLASALLSSLWAPALYFPLNLLWEKFTPESEL
jgi:rod shape-determining protein MreD